MGEMKVNAKWGFGMAPISARMQSRYDNAVQTALDLIDGNLSPEEVNLDHLSDLKGMFNRCLRQDQWDWFSVFTELGQPSHGDLKVLGGRIAQFRSAVKERSLPEIEQSKRLLIAANLLSYLLTWQDRVVQTGGSTDDGWIYILSSREQPEILKIGMTNRNVAQRVKEINAATGVLIPYAARKVFRVLNAATAERELFSRLAKYRVRADREFFRLPFGTAVCIIEEYLETSRMRSRQRGELIWFDAKKQYGFISDGTSDDIFLHAAHLEGVDTPSLIPGFSLEFDVTHRPQGRCALRACPAPTS